MSDFQSFLFQNMHMIGLEEDEEERKTHKSNNSSSIPSASSSANSSKLSSKNSVDGKIFKAYGSISVSTTETYLSSNSNLNRKDFEVNLTKKFMENTQFRIEEDPYDLNNHEPKFNKKKSSDNSLETLPDPPMEVMDFYSKKDQLFESNVMDLDMNYIINIDDEIKNIEKSDSKSMSSPESNLKFNFKSSTPVNENKKKNDSSMSQDEREVKSPKFVKKKCNERLSYRKFSPCRSIFEKKTMSKASLNSFNEDESFHNSNYRLNRSDLGNSNYIVSSRIFEKKKPPQKSNTTSGSDLNLNSSSLESVLIEPYLVKFEEELIKNSKSGIIKDLSILNQSSLEPTPRNQKNVFQKYFNEFKNLTLKKNKSTPKHKGLDQDLFRKSSGEIEELVYDDDEPNILSKENLKNISKEQIPWDNLDSKSSSLLLDLVLDNLNKSLSSEDLPILYSKKGNKISKNQVKRWFDLLEKLANGENGAKNQELDVSNHSNHKSKLYTSKQYLINKKNQFLEKVNRKNHKSSTHEISQTGSDISKNVSKLYANVSPPVVDSKSDVESDEKSEIDTPVKKPKKLNEQNYMNENFFKEKKEKVSEVSKQKSPRKLNPDHFYNEITDLETRQAMKHKNREKERVERNVEIESKQLSKRNSEILQQIVDYTQTSVHDSTSNMIFKRNIAAISNLKSPERKILYKEWFTVLKRMEKDPKFDLETLVRTRGRFTDNDKISYRTKLMEKNDKIRTARSEPSFSTMFTDRVNKTRNGMNTTPASKAPRGTNYNSNEDNKQKDEPKPEPVSQNALKLTLEKSDINKIKDLLKKKDKSLKIDLTKLKVTTTQRKLQSKKEMANQQQKQRLATSIINEEECEDNEDNLKLRQNSHPRHQHHQTLNNNKQKQSKQPKSKNKISNNSNSNLGDSMLETDHQMDDNDTQNNSINQKQESKIMSKCKKMYTNSETAKAFNEVTKMVKGLKIGSKFRNFTNSSSKLIHKAMHHNEEQNESDSERVKNANSESGSQASISLSSSNISEDEIPKRPQRRSREDEGKDRRHGSSTRREDVKRPKESSNSRNASSKVGSSPARPPPPKRPPPPRPLSPATSCSSISTQVKKPSRHRYEEDESLNSSPPQRPKRSSNNLPPRPKPPSNLPPRPPKNRNESFDDNSFEIEERNHRSKNDRNEDRSKQKRASSNNSRHDHREHGKKNSSRNCTPVRSPTMIREIKSKSNGRKEASRR
ncbi:unnamed protein product [Brachionus calyciflorus]|uniref:Uncharacterized protein n=1 Tax=Brachionus calyciflorus TaxID=104777 RepID=A0A814FCG5_9BILA|nr:unnamed protein product [Brachionus calyciflorus]